MLENKPNLLKSSVAQLSIVLGLACLLTTPLFGASNDVSLSATTGGEIGFADDLVCATPIIELPPELSSVEAEDISDQETALEGDEMDLIDGNKVVMTGNAYVIQGKRGVFADKITYDQEEYSAKADGNVVYYTLNGDQVNAKSLQIEVDTFIGDATDAKMKIVNQKDNSRIYSDRPSGNYFEDYSLFAPFLNRLDNNVEDEQGDTGQLFVGGRVTADKIDFEGVDFQRLHNASFTRCAAGEDVLIKGEEVELDHTEGVGRAKNITLKFKGVPILYAPYFTFPLNDERKSGFLSPSLGKDGDSGTILAVPYYFNIAPQYDATIRPSYLSKRGVQLYSEFRFMNDIGDGSMRVEYLPGDDLFDGQNRYAFDLDAKQNYSNGWKLNVDLQDVSDTSYLNDFRNDINITSSTFLPQTVQLDYRGDAFYMKNKVSKYISSSPDLTNPPLDRLPQTKFGIRRPLDVGPFEFDAEGEFVTFDTDEEDQVVGSRLNLTPSLELPITPIYGFLKPKLSFNTINYQLDNLAAGEDDAPSVAVPIFSVDSGLYFERNINLGGIDMFQTLEPRAMYVYIPEEDQDDLPLFDTGSGTSVNSYSVLFREKRLFGRDRIGDDHHVALGVKTQISDDETGKQRLSASIGQMYYIDDREVSAKSSSTIDTNNRDDKSDIFADLNITMTDELKLDSNVRWDQEENKLAYANFGLDYRSGKRRALSVDYYLNQSFDDDDDDDDEDDDADTESLRLQLDWPITPKIQFQANELYSIEDSELRASSVGLVYDNCCWAVGLKATRLLKSDGEYRNAIMATFELTGLGSIQAAQ